MLLREIELENFTNYEKACCILDERINIFIGDNAQGKSNLLEGIYYLSAIRSSRNHKDKELVQWGREGFQIKALFRNRMGENKVSILFRDNKKEIFLNNCRLEKKKDYIGQFLTILFTPEDLSIIKGDPSLRRSYIDNELMMTDVDYFLTLHRYRKILEQRNNLLKESYRRSIAEETMDVWEEQLSLYGTKLLEKRMEMIGRIREIAAVIHRFITDGEEELEAKYSCSLEKELLLEGKRDEFIRSYRNALKETRAKDIERGYTGIGPHRDDLDLYINGISAKKYGSQGQQRTAALSLKVAEIEFVKEKTGEYPLLLLDDVLSELDKKRKNKLLEAIENKVQTIITTTDLNDIDASIQEKGKIIRIEKGKVS